MVKHVLRHRGVSTRKNYFRMPARARGKERAPCGAETRAKFVTLAVSPKNVFRPIRLKLHQNVGHIISYRVVKFQTD